MPFLQKSSWLLFAFLSIAIGIYPILYFVFGRQFGVLNAHDPEQLTNLFWNIAFYTHITLGGLALAVGWVQFNQKLRDRNRKLHKRIGMIYVTAVFFSGLAGVYVAIYTLGGIIASMGFALLGITWLITTLMGWKTAKAKDFVSHENWMIYSYAACFAAVTLRIYLPFLENIMGGFIPAYQIVAWLCWVPNMAVAFWLVRKNQPSSQ
ncbi:membrane protein [Algoriphagus machipongonensis]|uniref:Membrane protein n=2 Tax=Algoriphagus machipongonensis TaxID=388413 RepID=A3HTM8_9BACT|nr:membrane protein [Algoriphagus machipongonensis]